MVWADTGGTFTDCLAVSPEGVISRAKVLSSSALRGTIVSKIGERVLRVGENWSAPAGLPVGFRFHLLGDKRDCGRVTAYDPAAETITLDTDLPSDIRTGATFEVCSPEEAPLLAARLVTKTPQGQTLPPIEFRLATTRGTNALLTRSGVAPILFLTEGFGDLLTIGTQQRPELFALSIRKPAPLYQAVVEVSGRLATDGTVLVPLDEKDVYRAGREAVAAGATTAAVALLHAATNPEHEQRVAEILRECGFTHISLSSEIAPFIKVLPRAQTAVVNAYLAPVLNRYIASVQDAAPDLKMMNSAGGLVSAEAFRPKDALLSGPAGGIVGAAKAARAAGFKRILAFDMGGTSTDVARYDGGFEYTFEHGVGDAHLVAPALAIESVAAGGGSICAYDRRGLRVGPESAGASPGPACYGAGGPLTITDVNLLLGRVPADSFEIPVDPEAAAHAAASLLALIHADSTPGASPMTRDEMLSGFLAIANERMADTIRQVSTRRGYDPSEYALLSFGGAGGQHACAVADRLGVRTVIVPDDASLLSAWGIGQAAVERIAARQVLQPHSKCGDIELAILIAELTDEAGAALRTEGVGGAEGIGSVRVLVSARLVGQETALDLDYHSGGRIAELFRNRYRAIYGADSPTNREIEIESVRVVVSVEMSAPPVATDAEVVWTKCNKSSIELLVGRHSTVVVDPGWQVRTHKSGALILERQDTATVKPIENRGSSLVEETLFSARFAAIAGEMGEMLRRTAVSVNVKERLDFSCAVLGPDGGLIATAAHIPVHLGALSACVRSVADVLEMAEGDTVVVNHPAYGGSHLPDITLITPVFDSSGVRVGYVANRAHHAEVGGTRPGSMPPNATRLIEEGVVLPPTYLVRAGESQLETVMAAFTDCPFPSRNPGENRADLLAALAANRRGAELLRGLTDQYGAETVIAQMGAVTNRAAMVLTDALRKLPQGEYPAIEAIDGGGQIQVRITVTRGHVLFDFDGTSPTHPGNLNAPPAVVRSAVLYVLRLLVGEDIPLNDGLLRPVQILLPSDSLINPEFDRANPENCPAVVGGNTETSQKIVSTLLKALGLAAGSQGTMNNILFGNPHFGYYETVCGGAGATPDAPGADAIHTHMTNTRITDVEVLERRYPVRLIRFQVRPGSGGVGRQPGGNGAIREYEFLTPVSVSVVTSNRERGPYGLVGGESGIAGSQYLVRTNGEILELPAVGGAEAAPGDRLVLFTPGGGGWGKVLPTGD